MSISLHISLRCCCCSAAAWLVLFSLFLSLSHSLRFPFNNCLCFHACTCVCVAHCTYTRTLCSKQKTFFPFLSLALARLHEKCVRQKKPSSILNRHMCFTIKFRVSRSLATLTWGAEIKSHRAAISPYKFFHPLADFPVFFSSLVAIA
jgi:hypothetical protein